MYKHVKDYDENFMYEIFIRSAFKVDRFSRKVGHWNDDFSKVRLRVEAAVDKFLTKRINKEERGHLLNLKEKLWLCKGKESLERLVNEALEITRRHRE